jgi:hypothetical protein
VFTGTVRSVVDLSDTDKILTLAPDEVFRGEQASVVTATVNQACMDPNLPEIRTGDQWLFYLEGVGGVRVAESAAVLHMAFDGSSKPVSQAEEDIERLRHLSRLTSEGLVVGGVIRIGPTYDSLDPTPVQNHTVRATGWSGEQATATDDRGHYELELPAGSYEVTANTDRGFKHQSGPEGIWTNVPERGCVDLDFTLLVDGHLAGSVTAADGKPASFINVAIVPTQPRGAPFTVVADENGHFDVEGRQPGRYVIGVGLLEPFASQEWKSRVYYPGVSTQDQAQTIDLGVGEWRTDLDFKLPATAGSR